MALGGTPPCHLRERKLAAWVKGCEAAENPLFSIRTKAKELGQAYKCGFGGEGGLPSEDCVRGFTHRLRNAYG